MYDGDDVGQQDSSFGNIDVGFVVFGIVGEKVGFNDDGSTETTSVGMIDGKIACVGITDGNAVG